jgi:putative DNA primase/helicase
MNAVENLISLADREQEDKEIFDREVDRLATLSVMDYERERVGAAKRLSVRTSVLDALVARTRNASAEESEIGRGRIMKITKPEPWPEPVEGVALLDDLEAAIKRYVVLTEAAARAVALWALHTYVFEAFDVTPRLAITSPEMRCGKSTLLRVIGALVNKPMSAANITAPAMFRTIEACRPCLLIDEADTFMSDNEELRGVVNSGHHRDGGVVRLVGEEHEPRQFSTWSPVLIAAIGQLAGTIMDRSIRIEMRRRMPGEQVERLRNGGGGELRDLARCCARWAADHSDRLSGADPAVPTDLNDRQSDNWLCLLALADLAGGDWPAKARAAALDLNVADDDGESRRIELLADIRMVFADKDVGRLKSADLCEALADMADRPWADFARGKPISPSQLAKMLKTHKIAPKVLRDGGAATFRGYELTDFDEAFLRYLPQTTPGDVTDVTSLISKQDIVPGDVT